jgi:hypothetical protein
VSASVPFYVLLLTLCIGLLSKLQPVVSGRYNALGAPTGCLENTRVSVLDTLMKWAEDGTSTQYVYWLSGLAGTGKTAIMRSLCERLAERQLLGASFFISRAADNRHDVRCILQTLIDQLARKSTGLRKSICATLESNPDVVELALEYQLRDLLEMPYSTSAHDFTHPLVLVIDAFDECRKDKDSGRHGGDFLPLLLRALSRCQPYLKLVITSRLDKPILDMFKDVNPTTMRLHEMDWMAVHPDMRLYLLKGFERILTKKRLLLQGRWPTEDEIDLLVRRADKLFVYAATLLKYIGHSAFYPPDRLNIILRNAPSLETSHAFHELDHLYSLALQDATTPPETTSIEEQEEIAVQLRRLLSILLVIQNPPSVTDLADYVDEREEIVRLRLESVSAIILVPEDNAARDVRFFHTSFPDYLIDPSRCTDQRFLLSVEQSHGVLLLRMLELRFSQNNPDYSKGIYTAENRYYHMERAPVSIYEEAIIACRIAVQEAVNSQSHDTRYVAQHYLAMLHRSRYLRTGTTMDLDMSIMLGRQNVELCAMGSLNRPLQQHNLAAALLDQFHQSGKPEALTESLQLSREVIALRPPGHPSRIQSLDSLASSLRAQFWHTGNAEALVESEKLDREALALHPSGHPDRHNSLSSLATSLRAQFGHSGRYEALIESLQLDREALALRPTGHPDRHYSLSSLAASLQHQFQHSGNIEALTTSVQLNREALALLRPGHPNRLSCFRSLSASLRDLFQHSGDIEVLRDSVQLEREALALRPLGHPDRYESLQNLAVSLRNLFQCSGNVEVLTEVVQRNQESFAMHPPGHPDRHISLRKLFVWLRHQFRQSANLGALAESVRLEREALALCPPGHANHYLSLSSLAVALLSQFELSGDVAALHDAVQLLREILELHTSSHPEHHNSLNNLGWGLHLQHKHSRSTETLSEAIKLYTNAVELCPPENSSQHYLLDNLASALRDDFQNSGDREVLDRAERLHREALSLRPPGHFNRPESLNNLALVLADQSRIASDLESLTQALDMHLEAAELARPRTLDYQRALFGLGETLTWHRSRAGELRRFNEAMAIFRDSAPYGFLAPRWRELQGGWYLLCLYVYMNLTSVH